MADFANIIKKAVPGVPVITAGRLQNPATANKILEQGTADLIGLARVLLADPLWPKKAQKITEFNVKKWSENFIVLTYRYELYLSFRNSQ